ncbi:MAG: hypothetical protein DRH08_04570 [Deltaproteobacteria bacterium]|nr:MAG: hypothetical protein DRH08_04570 [Deltaproteobacteria bacterium]
MKVRAKKGNIFARYDMCPYKKIALTTLGHRLAYKQEDIHEYSQKIGYHRVAPSYPGYRILKEYCNK